MSESTSATHPDTLAALAAFAAGLEPRPKLTVSQWAERYRILPAKGSAEPGPWRNARTPYLVEPMDCLSAHHPADTVVLMFGSQLGKSEALNNFVGYVIDHAPGPMLMVQPTEGVAEQYSKQRLGPLCETPPIAGKVRDPRARDSGNTTLQKEFPGGTLVLRGANSAAGLAGMPMQYALFDEVDRYPDDVSDEGDPVTVGTQRTRTYAHSRKVAVTSTPTVKGASRVEAEFLLTDQRRYFVPCPECGAFQVLRWTPTETELGGVVWDASDPRATARYQCAHCPARIHPRHRDAMVAAGVWRATAPSDGRRVGFHLSALASPWVTWGELAEMFLEAKRAGPSKLKAFVNLQLGESWDPGDVATVDARGIELRCEKGWGAGRAVEVPAKAAVLTAGIDIQPARGCAVIEVVAWGEQLESWSVDYLTIDGDPTTLPPRGIWAELDAALARRYTHPTLGDMPIRAVCIDTGASTQNVYAYVRPRQKRRVWGIKGREDHGQPIWPAKPTKNAKGVELRSINVDQAKTDVYWRLLLKEPGPGYSHFPVGRDPSYFAELTAEQLKTTYRHGRGRTQWVVRDGQRNEALDVRVYAYAAVLGLIAQRAVRLTAPKPTRPSALPREGATARVDTEAAAPLDSPGIRAPAAKARPRRGGARGGWWGEALDGW